MKLQAVSRRQAMGFSAAALAGSALFQTAIVEPAAGKPVPPACGFCLNTGTIRGKKLPLTEAIDVTAKAGYQAIEPWVFEIKQHVDAGGSLADLKKRIADAGLIVASAIGFTDWIGDDDAKRSAGIEQWKRDAEMVAAIGGSRMAAPPGGAYKAPMELQKVAERFRHLVDLSRELGIMPQLELWGGSKTLCRLGEVAFVLAEAARPEAGAVLDVFHIYKGGSDFAGLRAFNGSMLHVFHMNDYPADPPRETAKDSDRVYPGDGKASFPAILRDLHAIGFRGLFSLELFNPEYWKQDALTIAKTGIQKLQAIVSLQEPAGK